MITAGKLEDDVVMVGLLVEGVVETVEDVLEAELEEVVEEEVLEVEDEEALELALVEDDNEEVEAGAEVEGVIVGRIGIGIGISGSIDTEVDAEALDGRVALDQRY